MSDLIDKKMVGLIRSTGSPFEDDPNRKDLMESFGLPYDRPAENVVITGCQVIKVQSAIPAIQKLARILDRGGIDYTFLSKEYCCGNYLYRPAIKARDEDAMTECRSYSKEFAGLNIEQAKKLGARRLILFCPPCYPIYKFAFPEEDIIFYPQAIKEAIEPLKWPKEIDYYAGCYRLHRKFSNVPMDLKSTNEVFDKIEGLTINRISAPACCYTDEGITHMIDHVKTDYLVHICPGCFFRALDNMPKDRQVNIRMLPEFIDMIQGG